MVVTVFIWLPPNRGRLIGNRFVGASAPVEGAVHSINSRRSEGLAGSLIVAIASTPQVGSAGLYSDRATTCLCLEPGGHGNFDL